MKNLFKVLLAVALVIACLAFCVSCNGGSEQNDGSGFSGVTDLGNYAQIENSYRIRFVYSYTAKVENDNDRLEYQKSIVTVKSFFVPKDNPVISAEMINEMKSFYYHGFQFDSWYEEWDTSTQTPVGDPYSFPSKIDDDITLYCSRGDLAGADVHWSLEDVYTGDEVTGLRLRLSGSGDMYDFMEPNGIDIPWYDSLKTITEVVIDEGVTSVGNNSLNGFANLSSVSLPEGLKRIGVAAFRGTKLVSLTTPNSLESIEMEAFSNTALKEVVLNDNLTSLGESAFHGSNKIKSIVFPASITEIPTAVFHPGGKNGKNNSHSLAKVYYRGTEEQFNNIFINIDNTWFADKPTIFYYKDEPEGNETVEGNYWRYVQDDSGDKAPVQYCYIIKYVVGSAKTFLTSTYVPVEPQVDANGDFVHDDDGNVLLVGTITPDHLRFQDSIVYHGFKFAGFTGSKPLVIGDVINADMTYVCQRGKELSPDGGIKWSESTKEGVLNVYVDEKTEERITDDINGRMDENGRIVLFDSEIEILAEYLGVSVAVVESRIENDYIKISEAEKNAIIAGRLERSLYMWDFAQSADTTSLWSLNNNTINIGEGIKYIGKYAFTGISRTRSVIIPSSVDAVHANAFDGCADLLYIYYDGIIADECPSLNSLSSGVRAKTYSFIEYSDRDSVGNNTGNFWTSVPVSQTVNKYVAWTFTSQGNLTIGGEDEMVDFATPSDAPWYCVSEYIKSVDFVKNIKTIGENIVNGYSNLMKIDIPSNVRYIPESAFENCGMFLNVQSYTNGVIVVNGHLLKAIKNPEFFVVPNGVTTIAEGALRGHTKTTCIYIPRSVQYIHPDAMPDTQLEMILVDGNKTYWNSLTANLDFGVAEVYYRSNTTPTDTNDKYWYMSGTEYVIWVVSSSEKTEG